MRALRNVIRLVGAGLLGAAVFWSVPASAEELNDPTVDWLMQHAFVMLPDRFTTADQKVIKIDHTKPDDFYIPKEAAREVIKVANNSARAQVCHMIDKQRDNYASLVKHSQDAGKWNDKQLLYIKQLHLFVVQFATGTIKLTQVGDNQKVEVLPLPEALSKIKPCSDDEKKALVDKIDAYIKS
jgi:hypothetical protein